MNNKMFSFSIAELTTNQTGNQIIHKTGEMDYSSSEVKNMSAVIEISSNAKPIIGNFNGETLNLRRITVEQYDLMIESGVFNEDDQIELLNEVIIEKMPKGTKHSAANERVTRVFSRKLSEKVFIRNQNPIWLDDFSEPEPDIVLAIQKEDEYENSHPTPNEIFLILEIADSTLGYDRNTKGLAYSRAGIGQYLLVNIENNTIEDYRNPGDDGYGMKQTYKTGDKFSLLAFPQIEIAIEDFLQG